MTKLSSIVLFFTLLAFSGASQKIEKNLRSKIWFCTTDFNSDSLVLSAENTAKPNYELRFSNSGKLFLKDLNKKTTDSSYTYIIKKEALVLYFNAKDSVKSTRYTLKKISAKKSYLLQATFRSRYIQRKGNEHVVLDKFTLIRGKKRKTIKNEEEIVVFSENRARNNDSINRAVWGTFAGYISDTLLIESDQYVEHNFYKKYTDTLHYIAPLLLDTVVLVKVPIKDITGIICQREPLSSITTNATLLAMATGLVCVGASLIAGESSAGTIFAEVGIVSFLTIPFSFGTGLLYSKQKFLLKPTDKSNKIWYIKRHMPRTILTQSNLRLKSKK